MSHNEIRNLVEKIQENFANTDHFIFVKFCEFDEIRKSLNSQLTDSKYVFVS